jgi:hypothetical protein
MSTLNDHEMNQLVQDPRPTEQVSQNMERYITAYELVVPRLAQERDTALAEIQRLNGVNANLISDLTTRDQEVKRLQAELSDITTPQRTTLPVIEPLIPTPPSFTIKPSLLPTYNSSRTASAVST